jgi:hypothetical protein
LTASSGVRRIGPPQAIQKVRENLYLVQVPLSEPPSADWRRLFYESQQETPPDFPPRSIEISGTLLRFRSGADGIEQKITWIDRWVERANQKEAALGARSEEQRLRREAMERERRELAELNVRWTKL